MTLKVKDKLISKFDIDSDWLAIGIIFLLILVLCMISYLSVAGIWWVVCYAFGFSYWSWLTSLAVWLVLLLVNDMLSRVKGS